MKIEKAIHIGIQEVNNGKLLSKFERIYLGDEFCYKRMPSISVIKDIIRTYKTKKISIITPFLTQSDLASMKSFLTELNKLNHNLELVFNDWGVLNLILENNYNFEIVAGRLINKQKRDPRLKKIISNSNELESFYLKSTIADNTEITDFFKQNKIKRIELDNVVQGINKIKDMKASIYYPEVFISTSRKCMNSKGMYELRLDCKKECLHKRYTLEKSIFQKQIYVKGNYQFYINKQMPRHLSKLNIDRIVYNKQEFTKND